MDYDLYPEIELETDDLKLIITLKKDYSKINDFSSRKKELSNDLKDFINEFLKRKEFEELINYYD